ncbi:MAG: alanine racemase [Kordiimonadaceae bacterium]|jgi:alanine racemase|nr:alanine racemase [Kordiimonadaceae bacterium]MBT6031048.1 alanine racemase [Kordiimonadaceae bacterium]
MIDSNRRDFIKLASTVSAGVVLSGSAATMARAQEADVAGPPPQTVEDQYDPWVELNIDNLNHNIAEVRKKIDGRPIMAVIKCNAYGHGIVEIATSMALEGISHFAVVKMDEGELLRHRRVGGMILNLGPFSARDARTAITHNISQSVFSDAVNVLNEEARKLDRKAKVHIKIDTGLGRVGVPYKVADAFVEKVAALSHIEIEGVLTAMSEDADFNPIQISRLNAVYDNAKAKGIDLGLRHAASSAEVDHDPNSHLDMVRPGSSLVGLEPMPNMDIKPVLSVRTRVLYIKDMVPGEAIGYHQAFKIEKPMKIVTLPLGYSDGFSLNSVNTTEVIIKGRKYPMIALITANHTIIDVTGSDDIEIGDVVTIIGKDGYEEITNTEYSNQTSGHAYHTANCLKSYLTRLKV